MAPVNFVKERLEAGETVFGTWLQTASPTVANILAHSGMAKEQTGACPQCGRVTKIYDALCTRCGAELDFPEVAIAPESWERAPTAPTR